MKKNIWIINHYAGIMYVDKGGRHYYFSKYLIKNGYNPVVFCCNVKHNPGTEMYHEAFGLWKETIADEIGVPFIFVKARKYMGNSKQRVFNMIDFYQNVKKAAVRYAEEHGTPDIICASSVHPLTVLAGIQLAKYFGVKCICEIRDLWPESIVAYGLLNRNSLIARMLYKGEKYLYKRSDIIVMTWEGGYEYICDKGWSKEIPSEKVFHISNGVDLDTFDKNVCDCWFNEFPQNGKKYFVYTGSIRKVNHLRVLVDAAKIIQEFNDEAELLIFGDGDEKKELEELVKEKSLNNIKFMGKVQKKFVPNILSRSYATVLHNSSTSLDQYGQSQNKFFEYLAAGRPILMTYSVGYSIIKKENCGIELEEQTAENVALAIDKLCRLDKKDYIDYCSNARKQANQYDFKILTEHLINLIEK